MLLSSLAESITASTLNDNLKRTYDWQLDLKNLPRAKAEAMLETIKSKIQTIKTTPRLRTAKESNSYMEAVAVSQILEAHVDEMYLNETNERLRMKKITERQQSYLKVLESHRRVFDKKFGKAAPKVMEAVSKRMAESANPALIVDRIVRSATITEDQVSQARAVMATRSVVDAVQGMITKTGKLMYSDLPELIDAMRDDLGAEKADAYAAKVNEALNSLMEKLKSTRADLDTATRMSAGEEPIVEPMMSTDPSAPIEMPPEDDIDDVSAAADGGDLPLGRNQR